MQVVNLADVERAIRASWSPATCDPVDLADWSSSNSARGQCGVTALVLQDLFGGELLMAEVRHADGGRQGVHYWNRFGEDLEIDLTREQFTLGEVISAPSVVSRPKDLNCARLAAQYAVLAAAVRRQLSSDG